MDTTKAMQSPTQEDIKKILEILSLSEDSDTHVKIFSILAVALISNNDFADIIIPRNIIYNKIREVLIQKFPSKIVITLNFTSALLYTDEEEGPTRKKSLVLYAQNMIRNSGCLSAMCNLFISTMMHQDTWSALCRCIAESCQHCHENQIYCSHLIAQCVKKCTQADSEVIQTLKSLLNNNPHNMKLFLDCNGVSIFNRELMQYDVCLHLLDMFIQNVPIESLHSLSTQVFQHLQYFKMAHGVNNRVGQWATVIIYHLKTRLKGLKDDERSCYKIENKDLTKTNNHLNAPFLKPKYDDTAKLLQNVIREIYQYNANISMKKPRRKMTMSFDNNSNYSNENNNYFKKKFTPGYINIKDPLRPLSKLSNNSHNDLNFSFLQKEPAQDSLIHNNRNLFKSQIQEITMIKQLSKRTANEDYDVPIVNNCSSNFNNTLFQKQSGVHNMLNNSNTSDFRPTFVSTPKHRYNRTMNSSKRSCFSGRSLRTIKKVNVRNDEYKTNQKPQNKKDNSKMRSLKNRSISSRLFDVINDSCTTLVKTVTNIFKSNRSKMEAKDIAPASNTNAGANESCSYSFTEYMRKRDAGLINDVTKNTSGVSDERNFDNCKTCNDTLQLKRKIISDEYLRETIRKLKLGINIYGCDFKKISRAMWPRENYMTPEILYNLYRKLIIK